MKQKILLVSFGFIAATIIQFGITKLSPKMDFISSAEASNKDCQAYTSANNGLLMRELNEYRDKGYKVVSSNAFMVMNEIRFYYLVCK